MKQLRKKMEFYEDYLKMIRAFSKLSIKDEDGGDTDDDDDDDTDKDDMSKYLMS